MLILILLITGAGIFAVAVIAFLVAASGFGGVMSFFDIISEPPVTYRTDDEESGT